jgi:hypothetical protein
MFVSPSGTVTGSVNWAEVQRLVNDRDDDTVTAEGYTALQRMLDDHNGVLTEARDAEQARVDAAADAHARALDPAVADEAPSYDDQKLEDLKSQLKDRGLPTSGNKAELVERLNESDANPAPAEGDNSKEE